MQALVGRGVAADASGGCFVRPGVPVANCACHASCGTCGYLPWPTGAADCITCKDGGAVTPVYADGTGTCGVDADAGDAACFARPGVPVANCACHASCGTCGYLPWPTGAADCITCKDGGAVTPVYADGTGTCGVDADAGDAACFARPGVPVANCACHASCGTCGYLPWPTGAADCITCKDGGAVTPVYADGTGTDEHVDNVAPNDNHVDHIASDDDHVDHIASDDDHIDHIASDDDHINHIASDDDHVDNVASNDDNDDHIASDDDHIDHIASDDDHHHRTSTIHHHTTTSYDNHDDHDDHDDLNSLYNHHHATSNDDLHIHHQAFAGAKPRHRG